MASSDNSTTDLSADSLSKRLSSCQKKAKETDQCGIMDPKTNKVMSGPEACGKIADKTAQIVGANKNVSDAIDPIASMISNTSTQNIISSLKSEQLSEMVDIISNDCKNVTSTEQINLFDTAKCRADTEKQMITFIQLLQTSNPNLSAVDAVKAAKLLFPEREGRIIVDQTNKTKISSLCQLSSLAKQVASQAASIDNTALLKAAQSVSGLGDNTSNQFICSDLSVTQNACQYINTNNCCDNLADVSQSNTVLGCGSDILTLTQTNTIDLKNVCAITTNVDMTSEMAAALKNSASASVKQTTSFLPVGVIIAIIIGITVVVTVGSVMVIKTGMSVIDMVGPISTVVGLVLLGSWAGSQKGSNTRQNKPYSACKSASGTISNIPSISFASAKEEVRGNSDYVAVDFIVPDSVPQPINDKKESKDVIPLQDLTLDDSTKGIPVYLSNVGSSDCTDIKADNTKVRYISYREATNNKPLLFIGLALSIGGFLFVIVNSLIKKGKKDGENKDGGKKAKK
jgi:hypothetical protein